MIRWRSEAFKTLVELDVDSPEAKAKPLVTSQYDETTLNREIEETITGYLSEAYGAYGHRLGELCTGFDLAVAIASEAIAPYNFLIAEGTKLIVPPPSVPEGALS